MEREGGKEGSRRNMGVGGGEFYLEGIGRALVGPSRVGLTSHR